MTYTLEQGYGVKIVVPGAGFLLNNEMGDFNDAPEMTNDKGSIGTKPNLAEPGKRMLSSMTPTILAKDGKLFMVSGSPGGRTIINTVLETIVDAVDFGMNAQEAVDAVRFHHQWLPDVINYERFGFSPDTIKELERRGHTLREGGGQGVAQVIIYDAKDDMLDGGSDRRASDGAAVGVPGRTSARPATARTAIDAVGVQAAAPPPRSPPACRSGVVGACFSSRSMNSFDVVGRREILPRHRAPHAVHAAGRERTPDDGAGVDQRLHRPAREDRDAQPRLHELGDRLGQLHFLDPRRRRACRQQHVLQRPALLFRRIDEQRLVAHLRQADARLPREAVVLRRNQHQLVVEHPARDQPAIAHRRAHQPEIDLAGQQHLHRVMRRFDVDADLDPRERPADSAAAAAAASDSRCSTRS